MGKLSKGRPLTEKELEILCNDSIKRIEPLITADIKLQREKLKRVRG